MKRDRRCCQRQSEAIKCITYHSSLISNNRSQLDASFFQASRKLVVQISVGTRCEWQVQFLCSSNVTAFLFYVGGVRNRSHIVEAIAQLNDWSARLCGSFYACEILTQAHVF